MGIMGSINKTMFNLVGYVAIKNPLRIRTPLFNQFSNALGNNVNRLGNALNLGNIWGEVGLTRASALLSHLSKQGTSGVTIEKDLFGDCCIDGNKFHSLYDTRIKYPVFERALQKLLRPLVISSGMPAEQIATRIRVIDLGLELHDLFPAHQFSGVSSSHHFVNGYAQEIKDLELDLESQTAGKSYVASKYTKGLEVLVADAVRNNVPVEIYNCTAMDTLSILTSEGFNVTQILSAKDDFFRLYLATNNDFYKYVISALNPARAYYHVQETLSLLQVPERLVWRHYPFLSFDPNLSEEDLKVKIGKFHDQNVARVMRQYIGEAPSVYVHTHRGQFERILKRRILAAAYLRGLNIRNIVASLQREGATDTLVSYFDSLKTRYRLTDSRREAERIYRHKEGYSDWTRLERELYFLQTVPQFNSYEAISQIRTIMGTFRDWKNRVANLVDTIKDPVARDLCRRIAPHEKIIEYFRQKAIEHRELSPEKSKLYENVHSVMVRIFNVEKPELKDILALDTEYLHDMTTNVVFLIRFDDVFDALYNQMSTVRELKELKVFRGQDLRSLGIANFNIGQRLSAGGYFDCQVVKYEDASGEEKTILMGDLMYSKSMRHLMRYLVSTGQLRKVFYPAIGGGLGDTKPADTFIPLEVFYEGDRWQVGITHLNGKELNASILNHPYIMKLVSDGTYRVGRHAGVVTPYRESSEVIAELRNRGITTVELEIAHILRVLGEENAGSVDFTFFVQVSDVPGTQQSLDETQEKKSPKFLEIREGLFDHFVDMLGIRNFVMPERITGRGIRIIYENGEVKIVIGEKVFAVRDVADRPRGLDRKVKQIAKTLSEILPDELPVVLAELQRDLEIIITRIR